LENLSHILFEHPAAENLKRAIALDDIMEGDITVLTDNLAEGPLRQENTVDEHHRKAWNRKVLGENTADPAEEDRQKTETLVRKMEADTNLEIWVWAARHPRDVCGWLSLGKSLRKFSGRVQLLYLHNLPFLNEKGSIFYPHALSQVPPKEFLKARKLAREVSEASWESDEAEWNKLVRENQLLRIMDGNMTLKSLEASAEDAVLLSHTSPNFQKASRVVSIVQEKAAPFISVPFLAWRLRELVESALLECRDDMAANDFEVRLHPFKESQQQSVSAVNPDPFHTQGRPEQE
jgi:hypothetical protein